MVKPAVCNELCRQRSRSSQARKSNCLLCPPSSRNDGLDGAALELMRRRTVLPDMAIDRMACSFAQEADEYMRRRYRHNAWIADLPLFPRPRPGVQDKISLQRYLCTLRYAASRRMAGALAAWRGPLPRIIAAYCSCHVLGQSQPARRLADRLYQKVLF